MPRNSSGTYALPAGNPVVTNTLIQSTWANTTLSDVSTAMTDSLDRNGRGAMLAPLKNVDGTAVAPSVSFSSEGTLGIYRAAAGVLGFAVGGVLVLSLTSTGLTFTTPLVIPIGSAAAPALTFIANTNTGIYSPGTSQVSISTAGVDRLAVGATGTVTLSSGALVLNAAGSNFITALNAAGTLQFQTGGANTRLSIDASGNMLQASGNYTITAGIITLTGGQQVAFGASGANLITASNAAGTLAFQTGGANTRLSIDAAGVVTVAGAMTVSGAATFSSTVAHVGIVTFNNNIALDWKDSGGTARQAALLSSSNNFIFGDVANAVASSGAFLRANSLIEFDVNAAAIMTISATQVSTAKALFIVPGAAESLRLENDAAYISFFNTANSTRSGYLQMNASSGGAALVAEAAGAVNLTTSGGTLQLNTSANLGLAVTPSAWGAGLHVLQLTSYGSLYDWNAGFAGLATNSYYNGTNWIYRSSNFASRFEQSAGGGQQWYVAASGVGGNTITFAQAMTLDASGYFMIGTGGTISGAAGRGTIDVNGSSSAILALDTAGVQRAYFFHDGSNAFINAGTGVLNLQVGGTTRQSISTAGVSTFTAAAATTPAANVNSGTAIALDCRLSNVFQLTMTGNVAAAAASSQLTNMTDGQTVNIFITQDGTGTRTWALPSANGFKWPGGAVGVLSTAAASVDLLCVTYRASTGFYYCTLSKAFA